MTPLFRKFLGVNWIIVLNIVVLLAFGVWIVSIAAEGRVGFEGIWKKQLVLGCAGLIVMLVAALLDYRWLRWGAWVLYAGALAGLVLVQVIGTKQGTFAKSWISIGGGLSVQPSQFAIVAGIAALAIVFGDLQRIAPVFRYPFLRIALGGVMTLIPMGLILKEPDLGSAMVWGPVFVSMLLVGSIPFRYLIVLALTAITIMPIAYVFGMKDHQRDRIDTYWRMLTNQHVNILESAWVPNYLQIAVGSAGFQGKFKGRARTTASSTQRRTVHETFFPNEAINDYISGVICEEFGFRGMLLVITAFSLLIFQCVFVAFYSRDQLGRLLVVGIVAALMTYIFINIGMNILLVPITGLPLPLVGAGGTFLLVVMFMFGLIQSVWVHRNIAPVRHVNARDDLD
jgi:rod shape determining protein RodA